MDKVAVKLRDQSSAFQDLSQNKSVSGKQVTYLLKTPKIIKAIANGTLIVDDAATIQFAKEAEAVDTKAQEDVVPLETKDKGGKK